MGPLQCRHQLREPLGQPVKAPGGYLASEQGPEDSEDIDCTIDRGDGEGRPKETRVIFFRPSLNPEEGLSF